MFDIQKKHLESTCELIEAVRRISVITKLKTVVGV